MASGLLDKANIILTPTGYKAGTMYNVAPIEQPYEDFVFSRASVASRVNSSGLVEMVGRTLGSNLVQNGDFSDIGPDLVQNGTFDLGSELVTNGDFATDSDWTKGTGWSISNGSASYDGSGTGYQFILQGITTTTGSTYKINFDVLSSTGSNLNIVDFGAVRVNQTHLTAGNYTYYAQADASSENLVIYANGTDTFSIDNVSVKEVPDWTLGTGWSVEDNKAYFDNSTGTEITQSLSTTANTYKINFDLDLQSGSCRVYFNSPGISTQITLTSSGNKTAYVTTTTNHTKFTIAGTGGSEFNITNVVVQQLDPNDYWNLGAGWSLGDDEAIATNTTADSLYQDALTLGKTYKVSFEITEITSGSIRLGIGINFSQYFTTAGTYTYYGEPTFDGLLRINPTSSTNAKITNVTAQEIIDTNNIPRINYDSNGENGHWLLEPTSTNLVTYSEDFTQWTIQSGTTVTSNTTETLSPSGEYNSSKIVGNGASGIFKASVGSSGGSNTKSIYIKGTQNGQVVYLKDPNQTVNNKALTLTTEWVRYSLTETQTSDYGIWIDNIPSEGIYMYGGQVEALSYPTSYIPTLTGSTETRAAETATGAGSADLINSTEGVLYAEIAALETTSSGSNYISISDGTYNNRASILFTGGSTNNIRFFLRVGGTPQIDTSESVTDVKSFNKVALKYKENDFAVWINGEEVATDTSGNVWASGTINELAFTEIGTTLGAFRGKCKALTVFNTALTDAELTELTS